MPWASDPSLETTENFINRSIQYWQETNPRELPMIIELKSTSEIISGNGFITEAVTTITRFAFEYFSAVRVQICVQKENIKSINGARRCGFIEEAILKNYRTDCLYGKPCDEVIYVCFEQKFLRKLPLFKVIE